MYALMRKEAPEPARIYAPNGIRDLRKARGFSQEDLGAQMEPPVAGATISKLEKRTMALSLDYIQEIARVLECTPLEVIGASSPAPTLRLPVLGKIAAGNWREAMAETDAYAYFPAHLKGRGRFALKVEGDSMGHLVPDGGYVVVDPEDRDLIDGKLYAVMNADHETTFKRFRSNPPCLEPVSPNPEHRIIPLGYEPIITLGRIIYGGSDFD